MSGPFKLALVAFLVLLAAGIAFGVLRDRFSRELGELTGTVASVTFGGSDYKSPGPRVPKYTVRLPDGRTVDVATQNPRAIFVGQPIPLVEMQTPWGQVWYKHR